MLLNPTLRINRLVVRQGDRTAYDELFHAGVNIIHGEGGSGKTAVIDLLRFAIGGDVTNWRNEALACNFTIVEVSINGTPTTLRRQISAAAQRPMSIFFGTFEESQTASPGDWAEYPYGQQKGRQSFSSVLFDALGLPQVRGEMASRITMHQLLRLAMVDQRTYVGNLFRSEPWDTPGMRDAIGALLCGTYDDKLYEIELTLRNTRTEKDELTGRLSSTYQVLGGDNVNVETIRREIKSNETKRAEIRAQLEKLQTSKAHRARRSSDTTVGALRERARKERESVEGLREALMRADQEIADSSLFVDALRAHLQALDDSAVVGDELGKGAFELCPACYARIDQNVDGNRCSLCKSPGVNGKTRSRLLRLRQELLMQLEESATLQRRRVVDRETFARELPVAEARLRSLEQQYVDLTEGTVSEAERLVAEVNHRLGYLDAAVEDGERRLQLALGVEKLAKLKAQLEEDVRELEVRRAERLRNREAKDREARIRISVLATEILHCDLKREESFERAQSVEVSFANDRFSVDGRVNLGESSVVMLRNAVHVAILLASTEKDYFRYPRFLVLDELEDKGMEPERSHNLQRVICKLSAEAKAEHQIVFTTTVLDPELEDKTIIVGRKYTGSAKSLRLG